MLLKRILISTVLGLIFGIVISEISFLLLHRYDRAPMRIELVIPAGTADQIAKGSTPPNIPSDMSFVLDDTLVVINHDSVGHTLGPLWIPANSTATLQLQQPGSLTFECSFQPTHYFGLTVNEALTVSMRLVGILEAGIPMAILIALYSLLVWPVKKNVA